jgi:VanZ like protein
MFEHQYGGQFLTIGAICLVALALALLLRRRPAGPLGLNWSAAALTLGSGAAIAVATLTPRGHAFAAGEVKLIPFHTVHNLLYHGMATSVLLYALGNVLLFAPLGFFGFLALGRRLRHGVRRTAFAVSVCSLCVEILQLGIWSRSTDVDDWILNSVGGLVGALAAAALVEMITGSPPSPVPVSGERAARPDRQPQL